MEVRLLALLTVLTASLYPAITSAQSIEVGPLVRGSITRERAFHCFGDAMTLDRGLNAIYLYFADDASSERFMDYSTEQLKGLTNVTPQLTSDYLALARLAWANRADPSFPYKYFLKCIQDSR